MSYVEPHMKAALDKHSLAEIPCGGECRMFRMSKPNTRTYLVQILFTPEGIALMGDIRIGGGNGIVSGHGYGFDWFCGELGEDYLCEKFLPKVWVPEHDAKWCREEAKEEESPEKKKELLRLADGLEHGEISEEDIRIAFEGMGYDAGPDYTYDPVDAGWLCAVQQRFVQLWRESKCPR